MTPPSRELKRPLCQPPIHPGWFWLGPVAGVWSQGHVSDHGLISPTLAPREILSWSHCQAPPPAARVWALGSPAPRRKCLHAESARPAGIVSLGCYTGLSECSVLVPQRVSSDNLFPEIMFPSLCAARGFDSHLVKRPSTPLLGKLRVMFRSCLPEGRCGARAGGQMSDEQGMVTAWAR